MSNKSLSIKSDKHIQTTFSFKRTVTEDEVCSHFSHTCCHCPVGESAGEQACQAGGASW